MRSIMMLAYIRLLYDVEREARDHKLDGEAGRALRQKKSKPILDDIQTYPTHPRARYGPRRFVPVLFVYRPFLSLYSFVT